MPLLPKHAPEREFTSFVCVRLNRFEPRRSSTPDNMSTSMKATRSQKFGDFMEGRLPQPPHVKRWDGAARVTASWDNIRRDPELWHRSGNCLVHLYGKGQSRRGPAFKVPFSALLAARCHPLIQRFVARDGPHSPGSEQRRWEELEAWTRSNPTRTVELYIPAPPGADKGQAYRYHLATRNFFAWVFRRSLVGDHLGAALVNLMNSMHEFRLPGEDNIADLRDYLEEEGYLQMREQANHALAILHLAEFFQLRDLYIGAFAHCTGMSSRLFLSSEYQYTSSVSQKLIRRAKVDMDLRLIRASEMLRTFLEDELSETHLGLAVGARAHLERFRSFLLSFYSTKLGYYPPRSIDNRALMFRKDVYATMRADFESLYALLVDETFTSSENSPLLAQGGICAVQSVHSFDQRCRFKSLQHPLPLLPEIGPAAAAASKRLSWLAKPDKLQPDQRLVSHAALVKASNSGKVDLLKNDLVQAYRGFEEESIVSPMRIDRKEKLTLVDARKVRWILIYATYQVLRSVTEPPPEVREADTAPYHVAISLSNLPPWKEGRAIQSLLRRQTDMTAQPPLPDVLIPSPSQLSELRPDIDYFALAHKADAANMRPKSLAIRPISTGPRSRSLTRNFTQRELFRRSLNIFRSPQAVTPFALPAKSSYHEIVVHGYGNGTNAVSIETQSGVEGEPKTTATRRPSTSAHSDSDPELDSSGSTVSTTPTSAATPSPKTPQSSVSWESGDAGEIIAPIPIRGRRRDIVSMLPGGSISQLFHPPSRPLSAVCSTGLRTPVPSDVKEWAAGKLQPSPLRIRKVCGDGMVGLDTNPPALLLPRIVTDDVHLEWEQFANLGGHTPV